jgi:hypothetical protein
MEGTAVNRRLAGLAAVAAVLGGYLAFDGLPSLAPGGGEQPVTSTDVPRTAEVKLNPLEGLDPESFSAIVDQPLFNPTREPRPPVPVTPPAPEVEQPVMEQPPPPPPPQGPGPEDYKLLGVSAGPDGRIAALRIAASGEVVYLRKGESVDSWSVVDVGDRSVAIGTPENPVTFSMFAAAGPGSPDDGQMGGEEPAQGQPSPLPLPLPMPQPSQQQQGQPGLPEQYTLPPDAGG